MKLLSKLPWLLVIFGCQRMEVYEVSKGPARISKMEWRDVIYTSRD